MNEKDLLKKWTYLDAQDLYDIKYWGNNYFAISPEGEVTVTLQNAQSTREISIYKIIEGLVDRGFSLPILLRFKDILNDRLKSIYSSFKKAITEYDYGNIYQGVYPIKVNQQEEVIREIAEAGRPFHHGFEAGSKAELLAALAYLQDTKAYIICNGYKDEDFIDLALFSRKLGMQTVLVIERPRELQLIVERAAHHNIKPLIGFRVKLFSKSNGHWAESGGDKSVFGLTTIQIIQAIDYLKEQQMLDCLVLLHYHIGSQISDINTIRHAIAEASRIYLELCQEGANMQIIDIGGGLAVDYDGSQTNFISSKNYSLQEYCNNIIEGIVTTLKGTDIPHPIIVSESGRALVAYYSILLFDILDINRFITDEVPEPIPPDAHEFLVNMHVIHESLSVKNIQESFHDAIYYRDEIRTLFLHGDITLRERGTAEQLFCIILKKMTRMADKLRYKPEELQNIEETMIDTYYGNFSIFQSLPDSWAINQLFPLIPIHRLNEEPKVQACLSDVTCDCDGKINRFIDLHDIKKCLQLHELNEDRYIIGAFLTGAYQETLGDLHNLFGDPNVVSVSIDSKGELVYLRELAGDSIADVLSYVEYDPKELVSRFRSTAENAVRNSLITPQERKEIMNAYTQLLQSYTYLHKN